MEVFTLKPEHKKYLITIGIGVFLLYLCIHYWPNIAELGNLFLSAAMPLLVGGIIAYIVNLPMAWFERHYFPKSQKKFILKTRRPVSMLLAMISILAIIASIIWIVLPQLIDCVALIIDLVPDAIKTLLATVESWGLLPEDIYATLNSIDWESRMDQLIDVVTSGVGNVMDVVLKTVTSVFSGIISAFLAIIFALYLLLSKDKLGRQCNRVIQRYLKPVWQERIAYGLSVFNDCFHKYIVGQCTEALVLGVLCMLGMWIFQFPYASMIGALVAFTALIPIAGAWIGAFVGAFMILTVSPIKALLFLVYIVVLQQLEGNLIYPRVVGSSMGLPGIWVLAAVTVGGGVLGIPGMLLGVPLTAALYRILRDDLNKPRIKTAVPPTVKQEPPTNT